MADMKLEPHRPWAPSRGCRPELSPGASAHSCTAVGETQHPAAWPCTALQGAGSHHIRGQSSSEQRKHNPGPDTQWPSTLSHRAIPPLRGARSLWAPGGTLGNHAAPHLLTLVGRKRVLLSVGGGRGAWAVITRQEPSWRERGSEGHPPGDGRPFQRPQWQPVWLPPTRTMATQLPDANRLAGLESTYDSLRPPSLDCQARIHFCLTLSKHPTQGHRGISPAKPPSPGQVCAPM